MKTPETEATKDGQPSGLAVAPCSASTIFVLFVNTVVTVVLICAQASVDWAHAMMQFGGVLIGVSYGMFFAGTCFQRIALRRT